MDTPNIGSDGNTVALADYGWIVWHDTQIPYAGNSEWGKPGRGKNGSLCS